MNFTLPNMHQSRFLHMAMAALLGASLQTLAAQDKAELKAAQVLVMDSNCMKCHAVNRTKNGPSFKQIAARYKDKPTAEETLVAYLKRHGALKSTDDLAVRNVARYILSH